MNGWRDINVAMVKVDAALPASASTTDGKGAGANDTNDHYCSMKDDVSEVRPDRLRGCECLCAHDLLKLIKGGSYGVV